MCGEVSVGKANLIETSPDKRNHFCYILLKSAALARDTPRRFRAKSWRRTFDLEEYVIKEVVTFVRRGLDKVKKANAKALRYPQRHFGVSPRSLSYSAGEILAFIALLTGNVASGVGWKSPAIAGGECSSGKQFNYAA